MHIRPSVLVLTGALMAILVTQPFGGLVPQAFAAATAGELASAMGLEASDIVSSDLSTSSQDGVDVQTTAVGGFPTEGSSFAVLSTGQTSEVFGDQDDFRSTILDGLDTSQGNDLVQYTLVLNVPDGAEAVGFDWKFYSEEYPEFVGSPFNDAFLVEMGTSNYVLAMPPASTITAPNNVAFDSNGDLISINTSGATAVTAEDAAGTAYDGASPTLATCAPVPNDASTVTLIFSAFDMGDSIYDTTVFVDNIHFENTCGGGPTTKKASNIDCTVPSIAAVNSNLDVSSTLTDATSLAAISGATIEWSISPSGPTTSSVTNPSGVSEASLDLTGLAPGPYTVTALFAGDNTYQQDSCESTFEITGAPPVNTPPVLTEIPDQAINELETLTFAAVATDSDLPAQSLTFSLVGAPTGASIDPATGAFSWTPTEDQGPGSYTFDVVVSDGIDTDTGSITVTVNEVNLPPVLTNPGTETVGVGSAASIPMSATDPDIPANALTFSASGLPSWASINPATGEITGTPGAGDVGATSVTVQVEDNGSPILSDSETFDIVVSESPPPDNQDPDAVDDSDSTDQDESVTTDVLDNDSDPDGDTLTVTTVSDPANGSTTNNGDGTVTYTPDSGFTGTDTYQYSISDGNGGTDTATVTISVDVIVPPPTDDLFCGRTIDDFDNVIEGDSGDNLLKGTDGDDLIRGFAGDDRVFGKGGNDCLKGFEGNDSIWGGPGDDEILGLDGDDKLVGDAGNDKVNGHAGNDRIWGNADDDELLGEAGEDLLIGDAGNDEIWGGEDNDKLLGLEGNDALHGDDGNDKSYGGAGDDSVWGGEGEDIVVGDDGIDTLIGDGGNDSIFGNNDDDKAWGGPGDDKVNGGNGQDQLIGDAGNDSIHGRSGDDTIYDDEGDDKLNGGEDSDQCFDNVGTNTIVNCEKEDQNQNLISDPSQDTTNPDFDILTVQGPTDGKLRLTVAGTAGGTKPDETGEELLVFAYVFATDAGLVAVTSHSVEDSGQVENDLEWHTHLVGLDSNFCVNSISDYGSAHLQDNTLKVSGTDATNVDGALTVVLTVTPDDPQTQENELSVCVTQPLDLAPDNLLG